MKQIVKQKNKYINTKKHLKLKTIRTGGHKRALKNQQLKGVEKESQIHLELEQSVRER